MRSILLALLVLLGTLGASILCAQEVAIPLEGDCDDVIFPTVDVLAIVKYSGISNVKADLLAYSMSTGQPVWKLEAPLGKKFQLLNERVSFDPHGDQFYVGNGPITAVDVKNGNVLWTKPFKETGVARWIKPGESNLLILGSSRDSDVNNYDDLKKHMEKPRVICIDRMTGKTIWDYAFEAPENDQDVHVVYVAPGEGEADENLPDYTNGLLIVKGKALACVSCSDHAQKWITKKEAFGASLFDDGHLYANVDEKLCELSLKTGEPLWTSSQKIEKTSAIMALGLDRLLAIFPGELKDGNLEGKYKLFAMSRTEGAKVWVFDEGENFVEIENADDDALYVGDKSNHWRISLADGKATQKMKKKDDFAAGVWYFPDRMVEVGNGGLRCLAPGGKDVMWEKKLDRAGRGGGGFLSGALKVVSVASKVAAGSGPVTNRQDYMIKQMVRRNMERDSKKWQRSFTPPPYIRDEMYGSIGLLGDILVFPAKDKVVTAFSATSGKELWSIKTDKDNPWVYFSPDLGSLAVVDQKRIVLRQLQ